MLRTFCAGANLRALLQSESCPTALKAAVSVLEQQWNQNRQTRTIGEINNLGNCQIQKVGNGQKVLIPCEQYQTIFQTAFKSASKMFPETSSNGAFLIVQSHKHTSIGERLFATKSQLLWNTRVFFQSSEDKSPVPGVIESIFSIGGNCEEVFVLCV